MVCTSNIVAALATASIIGSAVAHPGETYTRTQIRRDIMKRDALAPEAKRGLEACSNTLKARQLDERAIARRSAKADKLRAARGASTSTPFLGRRNLTALEDFETHTHNLTATYSDEMTLFSSNGTSSCILTPEVTIGPYLVTTSTVNSFVPTSPKIKLEYQSILSSNLSTSPLAKELKT
jgi:hypothetical protein